MDSYFGKFQVGDNVLFKKTEFRGSYHPLVENCVYTIAEISPIKEGGFLYTLDIKTEMGNPISFYYNSWLYNHLFPIQEFLKDDYCIKASFSASAIVAPSPRIKPPSLGNTSKSEFRPGEKIFFREPSLTTMARGIEINTVYTIVKIVDCGEHQKVYLDIKTMEWGDAFFYSNSWIVPHIIRLEESI